MKRLQTLLFSLLCCSVLMAQSDPSPTIFSQVGKAKLMVPSVKKKMKVAPGTALGQEGILVLKKRATVGIFYNDGYTFLVGPGKFEVAPLRQSSRLEESDFVESLGAKLEEAQDPYFFQPRSGFASGPSNPSGSTSDPLQPPKKKETPGTGNKEANIIPVTPLTGKLTGNLISFSWEPKKDYEGITAYELTVMDNSNKTIFSKGTNGRFMVVAAEDIGLVSGLEYSWKVSDAADATSNSGVIPLEYIGDSGLSKLLEQIRADVAYQKADPAAKLMIEAATLDRREFASEAMKTIQLAEKEYPKNSLVQAMSHAMAYFKGVRDD